MKLEQNVTHRPSDRRTLPPGPPQRILVAEEDDETRELVVSAFLEDGWDVYGLDGEVALAECLDIIRRHSLRSPDLIAVGVQMAWHSGIDLVEGIRSSGWTTPVVLMTWSIPQDVRAHVARVGSTALVGKPFNAAELRSAARRARTSHSGPGLARAPLPAQPRPMARWNCP